MVGGNVTSNLTERDYTFGFSDEEAIRKQSRSNGNSVKVETSDDDGEDTELRLGIGPVSVSANSCSSSVRVSKNSADATVDQCLGISVEVSKEENQVGAGSKATALSTGASTASTGAFSSTPSVPNHGFWPWPGLAPGTYMIPIPKVFSTTVPAKRPFVDAVAESSNKIATANSSCGGMNTPYEGMKPSEAMGITSNSINKSPGGGGSYLNYSWNNNNINKNTSNVPLWHAPHYSSVCKPFEQEVQPSSSDSIAPKLAFPSGMPNPTPILRAFQHQQPPPPPPPPSAPSASFKIPPAPAVGALDSSSKPEATFRPHDSARNKVPAAVVGWPPVRSFRKNTLHHAIAANGSKGEEEAHQQANVETGKPGAGKDAAEAQGEPIGEARNTIGSCSVTGGGGGALYVKVKLDGVRICRKVDLKAYDSYESLKSGLQEMFQAFCSDHGAKLDLLEGKNYVLTHEDKDGDWMLVGDVPWHMFVDSTVKSFRIMKAADAIGLGERVYVKLKSQDNGKF